MYYNKYSELYSRKEFNKKKKTVQFYYNNLNMRFEPDEWNKIVLKSEKANFCRNLDTWQILRRSQMSFTFQFY